MKKIILTRNEIRKINELCCDNHNILLTAKTTGIGDIIKIIKQEEYADGNMNFIDITDYESF